MKFDFAKLERIHFRDPGPQTREVCDRLSRFKRFVAQSDIPLGPGGFCSWCNMAPIRPPFRKYCDAVCRSSADIYCYPQSPATKAYLFIEVQDFTCPVCGEIFEDEWAERLERKHQHGAFAQPTQVNYFRMGHNCGERWQVDHRIPISEGGAGVGLENLQVICAPCHLKKSGRENSARLKKLFKAGATPPESPDTPRPPEK